MVERVACIRCGAMIATVNLPSDCPSCGTHNNDHSVDEVKQKLELPAQIAFGIEVDGVLLQSQQVAAKMASARIRLAIAMPKFKQAKRTYAKAELELDTARKQIKEDVARAERINPNSGKMEKVYPNDMLREAEVSRRFLESYGREYVQLEVLEKEKEQIEDEMDLISNDISLYRDILALQTKLIELESSGLQADSIGQYAMVQQAVMQQAYDSVSGETVPPERGV